MYETLHVKTNQITFASSEDSDQPGRKPRLIWVFAERMNNIWARSYAFDASRRLRPDGVDSQTDLSICGAEG